MEPESRGDLIILLSATSGSEASTQVSHSKQCDKGMTGVDIKEEPSSPSTTLPLEHFDANEEGSAETALESIISESSKDIMDSSLGTSKSDTGSSRKKASRQCEQVARV
ncbi:hypothetical protein MTO96_004912 [Rhipicephalus appendiculatus]